MLKTVILQILEKEVFVTGFLWALAVLIFSSCVTLQAWVALQIGTALGCMGGTLNLVCVEIDLQLLQTRVLIAFGELKKVSISLCQFFVA